MSQMSRAPWRHDRTDCQARRLHLEVSQLPWEPALGCLDERSRSPSELVSYRAIKCSLSSLSQSSIEKQRAQHGRPSPKVHVAPGQKRPSCDQRGENEKEDAGPNLRAGGLFDDLRLTAVLLEDVREQV
jgi:hypothetical protein